MPRKPRVEDAGLHHIINRGVARGDIFLKEKDFEEFLQNIQIAKDRYDFIVHSLCLMSNLMGAAGYTEYYTYDDYIVWKGDWELIYGDAYAIAPFQL